MTSAPAIGFEYRPSAWPRRAQWLVAMLAATAVLIAGLGWWLKALLLAGVPLSLWLAAHTSRHAPVAVGWSAQSGWTLRHGDGEDRAAQLRSWRVLGGAICLCLADGMQAVTLWLLPDNCDADTRRRLRMRLATLQADSLRSED